MNLKELLAKLKELGVNVKQVIGEMGWSFEDLAKEVGGEAWAGVQASVKALGEMATVFGLKADAKPEEVLAAAKAAREAQGKLATAQHDQLVDKVVGEMVAAETVRPLVKRMLRVAADADEAAVKKAVGEMLQSEDVKKALSSVFKDTPIAPVDSTRTNQNDTGLRVRRAAI